MLPNAAVVHLQMRRGERPLAVGTGTLYRHDKGTYIVTAWHNVVGRHSESLKPLSPSGALPDNLIATIECQVVGGGLGPSAIRMPFRIPLEDDNSTFYLVHSQGWPRVDVVAIPIDPDGVYETDINVSSGAKHTLQSVMRQPGGVGGVATDIRFIQDFAGSAAHLSEAFTRRLGSSDDLFVLGYPKGIVDSLVQPLWKRATVATEPRFGWNGQKAFLIDCASREGMSGAPVVTHVKSGRLQIGGVTNIVGEPVTFLHGVYVSRISSGSLFEAQIGTVWQEAVIDEIIEAALPGLHSSELEASPQDIREAVAKAWPADEADFARKVLDPEHPVWITHSIMTALNGGADPADVITKVRAHAEAIISEVDRADV